MTSQNQSKSPENPTSQSKMFQIYLANKFYLTYQKNNKVIWGDTVTGETQEVSMEELQELRTFVNKAIITKIVTHKEPQNE